MYPIIFKGIPTDGCIAQWLPMKTPPCGGFALLLSKILSGAFAGSGFALLYFKDHADGSAS